MNISKMALGLMAATFVTSACDNPPIPKLVPVEANESLHVVQNVSGVDLSYPRVDILLVIDGSGSMAPHQENMQTNIDVFVEQLTKAKLDYQIAVTISGSFRDSSFRNIYSDIKDPMNSGLLHAANEMDPPPYFVTPDTPGGLEVLKHRIRVGDKHDHSETFFGPVVDALRHSLTSPQNRGFIREDAYFAPIFITDTDDQTKDGPGAEPGTFLSQLINFKGDANLIVPYSVHIPVSYGRKPPCSREANNSESQPHRIEEFLSIAGGRYFDLCASNFGEQLSDLGEDLVARIGSSFELEAVPDPTTILLRVDDIIIPNDPFKGWVYLPESNSIHLGTEIDVPHSENAKIRVEFARANNFRQ